MKSIPLLHNGVASLFVGMAALDGVSMPKRRFLVDTGATKTTILKAVLINALGYTEEYIRGNKTVLANIVFIPPDNGVQNRNSFAVGRYAVEP